MSLDLKMIKTSTLFLCTSLFSSMAFAENHYIPLLYNLSTMFDFNPVKGAVKSLDTDVEENGKITYKISIRLDKNGCVDSLNLDNVSSGHETILKYTNGSLIGHRDGKPFSIQLDEKCHILSKNENGDELRYTLYPNGLIKDTYFLGKKISEHFYDEDDNLTRSEFYSSESVMSKNDISYVDKKRKPLDYKLINSSVFSAGYTATSSCHYNEMLVPEICNATLQNAGNPAPKPVSMTAHTKVEFY